MSRWKNIKVQKSVAAPTQNDSAPPSAPASPQRGFPAEATRTDARAAISTSDRNVPPANVPDSDGFDMFDSNADVTADKAAGKVHVHVRGTVDDIKDKEGYFQPTIGEVLGGRYRVGGYFGQGVYGSVLRCEDLRKEHGEVAIKLLRANEYMKRSGIGEVQLAHHDVRLLPSFIPWCIG